MSLCRCAQPLYRLGGGREPTRCVQCGRRAFRRRPVKQASGRLLTLLCKTRPGARIAELLFR